MHRSPCVRTLLQFGGRTRRSQLPVCGNVTWRRCSPCPLFACHSACVKYLCFLGELLTSFPCRRLLWRQSPPTSAASALLRQPVFFLFLSSFTWKPVHSPLELTRWSLQLIADVWAFFYYKKLYIYILLCTYQVQATQNNKTLLHYHNYSRTLWVMCCLSSWHQGQHDISKGPFWPLTFAPVWMYLSIYLYRGVLLFSFL